MTCGAQHQTVTRSFLERFERGTKICEATGRFAEGRDKDISQLSKILIFFKTTKQSAKRTCWEAVEKTGHYRG